MAPTFRRIFEAADRAGDNCLVIAEVAQAHDGSLGMAHAFIDAIAQAGADVVKFQTHIAGAESTEREGWRTPFSKQDASRYAYWRRMEFTESQWRGLRAHATDRGLSFISSAFSDEAVALLRRVGVDAWKVASGEVASGSLINRMLEDRLPVLVSSGMSAWAEIDDAVGRVRSAGAPVAVMQCTSAYPCPPEKVGLNLLDEMQRRYHCPVGLSDHSGTIFAGLAAVAAGASLLEVHVTLSREMFGPDVASSVTTAELRELVQGVRFISRMRGAPVDKDAVAGELRGMRQIFGKSIVARSTLPKGAVLTADRIALKKPGGGLGEERLPEVLHRRLRRDINADCEILLEDLE